MDTPRRSIESHDQFHAQCLIGVIAIAIAAASALGLNEYRRHNQAGFDLLFPVLLPVLSAAWAFAIAWRMHRRGQQPAWVRFVSLALLGAFFCWPFFAALLR